MINDGLWDIYNNYHMGITARTSPKAQHHREQQDEYALNSHRKAVAAMKDGRFDSQIVPVELPAKKKTDPPALFTKDESPREDASIEALRSLKPAFRKTVPSLPGTLPVSMMELRPLSSPPLLALRSSVYSLGSDCWSGHQRG